MRIAQAQSTSKVWGYYSGYLFRSTWDERDARQSVMNGIYHIQSVFAGRRDVATNGTEGLRTSARPKRT